MLDPGADMQKEEAKLIIHTVQTLRQMYPLTSPSHRPDGGTRQWVFVFQDKDPQTVGEDHGDFFSHSSEPRNPKSRCWQACTFLQALGRILCVSSWLLAAPGIPWLAAAPPSLLLIFRLLLCGSLSSPLLTTTLVVRVRAHPNSGQPLLQTLLTKSTQAPLPNKVTITGTRGWEIDIFPSWRKYSSTKFRGLTMLPPC